jgi:hypothetical protein
MDEGSLWVSAILFVTVGLPFILACWAFMRKGMEPAKQVLGLFQINDFAIDKIRLAVIAKCKDAKLEGLPRAKAEALVENLACHAIAETFAEIYPGRPFEVKRSWPQARCIISGNIAVVDCWMGLDYADDGEGVKPVNVEVRRAPALKLETKQPIKAALGDSHGLPSNRSNERPEPQKATPVQVAKATPKRANLRNT